MRTLHQPSSEKRFVGVCGAEIQRIYFRELSLHKLFYREIESRNLGLWEFVEWVFRGAERRVESQYSRWKQAILPLSMKRGESGVESGF